MGDIPGDILVMLTPAGRADAIAADLRVLEGVETGLHVDHEASAPMRIWLLKFTPGTVSQDRMLRAVQQHPMVIMAQNDHPVTFRATPNDPQYNQQWHHPKIQSPQAWDVTTGGVTANGDTIVVCVVEGANMMHTDLVANRWLNHAEIPGNGIDDDGNGYVDDHRGWSPGGNNDNVYAGNVGHGTQVAGMVGAKGNNSVGVAGANWDVKIMPVTVGSLSQANVIASYTYPLVMRRLYHQSGGAQGAFVVATNASWGIDAANPNSYPLWCAMYDTLGTAGILNCGATTNSPLNVDVQGDMPTACPSPFMVSVTATNSNDMRTFSGYGATTIDVGAPGENVYTTSGSSGYGSTSGTSFASPLTAGVIGLLYSAPCESLAALALADPEAAAMYVREQLFAGVDQVGNLPGNTVTGGRINANNSMQLIMEACAACPAPLSVAAVPSGGSSATVSWTSNAGGPFTLRHRAVGTGTWITVPGIDGLSHVVAGIDLCVANEFEVSADCGEEESAFSAPAVLSPVLAVAPEITLGGPRVICQGGVVVLTASQTTGIQWSTGATTPTIVVETSGDYHVTYTGPCDAATSETVTVIVVGDQAPEAPDVMISQPEAVSLTATGDSVLWYATETSDAPIATGSPWTTPVIEQPTSYWVSNMVTGGMPLVQGGPADRLMPGAFHTNGSFWLTFDAYESFTIRSVKVFANGAGNRQIGLVQMPGGAVVAQGTFSIPNGESQVDLEFNVPAAGQYGLRIMSGDPQLWRDGLNSNPAFPYTLGSYGAITGTTATGNNATAYYYFFYDWQVQGPELTCETERTEVEITFSTGVNDPSAPGGTRLYPNPADRVVFIDLGDVRSGEEREIIVLDQAGRVVATKTTTTGRATISTAFLAEGLYFYRVLEHGVEQAVGKFVVDHL